MWVVRNGYTLVGTNYILEAGMEVPASILPSVLKTKGWLIEEEAIDGKQETEETIGSADTAEEETEKRKEKKVRNLIKDRMIKRDEARTS
jgi:hypothetical protein